MKKLISIVLALALCAALAACSGGGAAASAPPAGELAAKGASSAGAGPGAALTPDTMKVGFLYGSSIGDEGYTYAHNLGRLALEEMGIKTMYLENVPETADCEKAIRNLIDQGCNVIYGISFGFMDYMVNVAPDYPDVYFGHATGYKTLDNLSTYMGRMYEAQYLAGIAAGLRTESGKIGIVTTFPIPECVRQVNAFARGIRSVNEAATLEVKWTSSWFDPVAEKAAATELLNTGCDVIGAYCDTMNPQMAAAEQGKWATGCSSPGGNVIPDAYLTAPIFRWAEFYTADVQRILDGEWKGNTRWWMGLDTGVVALDELTDNCAPGTAEKVQAAQASILDGSFHVFSGEIRDNTGTVRVEAGQTMTDEEMLAMDWFVEGVIGTVN